MAIGTEIARLKRDVTALVQAVNMDMAARKLTPANRRELRAEIETCMQTLSELRNQLST